MIDSRLLPPHPLEHQATVAGQARGQMKLLACWYNTARLGAMTGLLKRVRNRLRQQQKGSRGRRGGKRKAQPVHCCPPTRLACVPPAPSASTGIRPRGSSAKNLGFMLEIRSGLRKDGGFCF